MHFLDVNVYLLLTHCATVFRYKSGPHKPHLCHCTLAHAYIRVKDHCLDKVTGYYFRDFAFTLNLPTSLGIILLIKCVSLSQQCSCPLIFFSLSSRQIHYVRLWLGAFSLDSPVNTVRSTSRCLCNTLTCKNCTQKTKNNSCRTSSYWLRVSYCFIFIWCGGNTS